MSEVTIVDDAGEDAGEESEHAAAVAEGAAGVHEEHAAEAAERAEGAVSAVEAAGELAADAAMESAVSAQEAATSAESAAILGSEIRDAMNANTAALSLLTEEIRANAAAQSSPAVQPEKSTPAPKDKPPAAGKKTFRSRYFGE